MENAKPRTASTTPPSGDSAARRLPLAKRGFNFEIIMWFYTRLSALAMYALIIAGFIGAFLVSAQTGANLADIFRWAFLPNTAANPLSAMPWAAVLTKLMVVGFILVLSAHGVHGVLAILDDYFTGRTARRWFRNLIIAFFVLANAIVIYVIWTS
jgi:succinate dehydrogenase hydrophobic anchor subunit